MTHLQLKDLAIVATLVIMGFFALADRTEAKTVTTTTCQQDMCVEKGRCAICTKKVERGPVGTVVHAILAAPVNLYDAL